ncbi:MAG: ORF6N domain-containing protein [Nitrospirota bacterium]|nr:ORF6N domain-containing protein [Nitrospirota bacterium]
MELTINTGTFEHKIYPIRGQKVMLDSDLAAMYGVNIGDLHRAVKRNMTRFPKDFMFQLTPDETETLRCQTGIMGLREHLTAQNAGITPARGKQRKYLPQVFTEQGVAMLSSVLKSRQAAHVNTAIMRTFISDSRFAVVFDAIREFMTQTDKIGFLARESMSVYKTVAERSLLAASKADRKKIHHEVAR